MSYFKCSVCGMYKDDGNPKIGVCAWCIFCLAREFHLKLISERK